MGGRCIQKAHIGCDSRQKKNKRQKAELLRMAIPLVSPAFTTCRGKNQSFAYSISQQLLLCGVNLL